ncbi:MAG: ammonium transporter [Pseudanabaenaceae cyanobacterium bins.39]|nr:ammonium transporter [Pseudanabaenaceae cyanobacterium bins.39]
MKFVIKKFILSALLVLCLVSFPFTDPTWAQATTSPIVTAPAASPINSGDTAFMLIAAALVLLMTPGLAFFYGGLVRTRNVLNTMMMSLLLMAVVGVTWVLWGYSLAFDVSIKAPEFGQGIEKFIGGLDWVFLNKVKFDDVDPVGYAGTIPHAVFMVYQMMFAIITPALISGAIVERMSFKAYFWFMILWSTLVYSPLAHMVWGRGFLGEIGALDFAGGTVVHISSGVAAVVSVLVVGSRKDFASRPHTPHNVPYVLLGIGLLWFGWFGFNAGSALSAGSVAAVAFVSTTVSTSAGGLTWLLIEWVLRGKPTAVGIASGFLAGLVGITPAAGFVTPIGGILIGSITSVCCFMAVSLRAKLKFDDSLDTFSVHGVGGTVGAMLTGIFATKTVNQLKDAKGEVINLGLLDGNISQIWIQFVGVAVTYIFAAIATFIILQVLKLFMELRVSPSVEEQGIDLPIHGEEAYGSEFGSGVFVNQGAVED